MYHTVYIVLKRVVNIVCLCLFTQENTRVKWKIHHGRVGNAQDTNASKRYKKLVKNTYQLN